ncbi:MAG: baseplate J/gp47 family protein [Ruminococcus sp.]|nr:baseplate J/gp47 family protein [Ruminococcus sp.]
METYEQILSRMTDKYTELSGIVPHEASDIAIRMKVLAGEVYSCLVQTQWLRRQIFADTAEGEFLDYHAMTRGLTRRQASCAVGEVIFAVTETPVSTITIPAGTVVSTGGENPLQFETTETVEILAGNLAAHALIRALAPGREYNVAQGAVSVLVTPPAGIGSVTNPDPCMGGTDTESDEMLRQRVLDSFRFASNGTNKVYYQTQAMDIPGVAGASVVPLGRGVGTVDVYISAEGSEVPEELIDEVSRRLSEMREVNVDVKVMQAQAVAVDFYVRIDVKDGYDFEQVSADCRQALEDYVNTRNVGQAVLLTEAGERIYHVEGVKEYVFVSGLNGDNRLDPSQYAVVGKISISQGVVR